jgi:hypothetical protein
LLRGFAQVVPPVALWDPEDALRRIFVAVLHDALLRLVGRHEVVAALVVDEPLQLLVAPGEDVGDILEEDQTEDDVLVFCGINAASQAIRSLPKRGLKALFALDILVARRHRHPPVSSNLRVAKSYRCPGRLFCVRRSHPVRRVLDV